MPEHEEGQYGVVNEVADYGESNFKPLTEAEKAAIKKELQNDTNQVGSK